MTAGVSRTSVACQCASVRPGINVRPPPSMIRVVALRSTAIGAREILSIRLPRTSTLVGSDSAVLLPSKTLTLLKSVTAVAPCWALATLAMTMSTQLRIADIKARKEKVIQTSQAGRKVSRNS
jgi:hypothetical protein